MKTSANGHEKQNLIWNYSYMSELSIDLIYIDSKWGYVERVMISVSTNCDKEYLSNRIS